MDRRVNRVAISDVEWVRVSIARPERPRCDITFVPRMEIAWVR